MALNVTSGALINQSSDGLTALRKPDFFIVGAAKAGTTSLYNYLKLHPEVYFSPIKEPHYFSTDINLEEMRSDFKKKASINIDEYINDNLGSPRHGAFVREAAHYHQLFSLAKDEKRLGESSVSYLYSGVAASKIKIFNPEAKIVIILREPIQRAFSHYLMDLRIGYETRTFTDAVNADVHKDKRGWGQSHLYVELGLYYEQVKRYLAIFDPENVKILLHDDFKTAPEKMLLDVYSFLDISDKANEIDFSVRHNKAELPKSRILQKLEKTPFMQKVLADFIPGALRRKLKSGFYSTKSLPNLTEEDRKSLQHYFSEDVKKLSALIGRDLSGWENSD